MTAQEKLDMLIQYELVDAPDNKKDKIGWSMYLANKIVNFVGARELTLLNGYSLESLQDPKLPNVYNMVAQRLLKA